MSAFQVHDHLDNSRKNMRHQIADLTFILVPKLFGTFTLISSGKGASNDTLKMVRAVE